MPRIERLKQNTPEWHRWRLQGLGASDAPVVMGDAPFRTRRYLWSVKTGLARETAVGAAARRGRALEYAARVAYERHAGIPMEPLCLVHDGLEWMRASLDGLSFDGALALEIKCPWGDRDRAALSAGRIPGHYYAQVQHQLEVSGAEELHYWSFDGRAGILVKVHHDRGHRFVDRDQTTRPVIGVPPAAPTTSTAATGKNAPTRLRHESFTNCLL